MTKLFLLRHFKSQWNLENRFTGWVDVPLLKERSEEEKKVAQKIAEADFQLVYTSPLIRNLETVLEIFKKIPQKYPLFRHFQGKMKKWANFQELNQNYIPVYISPAFNERYYGKLQGEDKAEMKKKYGQILVRQWRRSFHLAPPAGESLKKVYQRAIPFYRKYVEKDLKERKSVLIVISHNPARAIIKYLEKISDQEIINLEMSFGELREYQFEEGVYKKAN